MLWNDVYNARDPRLREVHSEVQLAKPANLIQIDCGFRAQKSTGWSEFNLDGILQDAIILDIDKLSFLLSNLTLQQNLTMAENNDDVPPPLVLPPPTNPPATFYQLDNAHTAEMRRTNYRGNGIGVGAYMVPHPTIARVLTTPVGDAIKLNEPNNLYAKQCLALIVHNMRDRLNNGPNTPGINRVGERDSCNLIMEEEAIRLMNLGNYGTEDITQRRLTVFWRVMCGFNSDGDGNAVLDQILVNFCRVRLGDIAKNCDELGAAVWAVKIYYDSITVDSADTGSGLWTLPVVHLLNFHMIHRGMTPIAFHQIGDTDDEVAINERAAHSDLIHVVGTPAKVEKRENVRNEMLTFLNDRMNVIIEIPEDEGPPAEDDGTGEPPAQRRRVLQLD